MGARLNTHKRGSTHGLTINDDQHWSHRGACASSDDPDLWSVRGQVPDWDAISRAVHICRSHCPVQEQCYREMAGLRSTVIGGYYFNDKGNLSSRQPVARRCRECIDMRPLLDERFGPVAIVERERRDGR